jgi:two-component system competent response regulator ComA
MPKVLIIDDDPVYADMTRQRMERAGYRVDVHIGPFGATAAVSDNAYDLVILDVFMPGLAGPDLLGIIRKSGAGSATRVLLCSSMDPGPLARVAEERGANGSISKAVGRAEFLRAVEQALAS